MAADTAKVTKPQANYRPSASKTVNCARCVMSVFGSSSEHGSGDNEGTCDKVSGPIGKKDVCRYFEAGK